MKNIILITSNTIYDNSLANMVKLRTLHAALEREGFTVLPANGAYTHKGITINEEVLIVDMDHIVLDAGLIEYFNTLASTFDQEYFVFVDDIGAAYRVTSESTEDDKELMGYFQIMKDSEPKVAPYTYLVSDGVFYRIVDEEELDKPQAVDPHTEFRARLIDDANKARSMNMWGD